MAGGWRWRGRGRRRRRPVLVLLLHPLAVVVGVGLHLVRRLLLRLLLGLRGRGGRRGGRRLTCLHVLPVMAVRLGRGVLWLLGWGRGHTQLWLLGLRGRRVVGRHVSHLLLAAR